MKIKFIRLRDFRNISFAEISLEADSVWIYGKNAQGKTNLLEAIGLLTALRSFRASKPSAMISKDKESSDILVCLEHETLGETEIQITLAQKKKVFLDGNELKSLGEFIGKFPALAMSSEDIRLIRGTPEIRRRDIDMFISGVDSNYFKSLCDYHAALIQRNALLRTSRADRFQFAAFEKRMAASAVEISELRHKWLEALAQRAGSIYSKLAGQNSEPAEMRFRSNADFKSEDDFLNMLDSDRTADIERGYTLRGPHRDDIIVHIDSKDAKSYASEGQQRSAVIALKLAQFAIFKENSGIEPVILCDDILGELDPGRRAAFWECIPSLAQIIATSTSPAPSESRGRHWTSIGADSGTFAKL